LLLLGIAALASSWLSVRPSSDHRYRQLEAREARQPGSVTDEEWILSKDDEGLTALTLVLVGLPALLLVTLSAWIGSRLSSRRLPFAATAGVAWIFLGGVLHACVWLA